MNRVTTKNTSNWFELLEPSPHRVHRLATRRAPDNVIWIQHAAPSARSRLWPASTSGTGRINDSWETVTYTALWLCGLIAIGLCWV